jgi:ABC-type glycerol-3-phosphate transport system substrate-binding protein
MKMKRVVSALLATVMTAGLMAGTASASSAGTYTDYSEGFTDRVTLEIPVYERGYEGWNVSDNYYTRWVQSEFGDKYNIDVKFVPITRNSQVSDYQQMLASHKAPDIIFHYDMPQALAYYGEGVMQPIEWEEVANYAPTYWENMGNTNELYGSVDGEDYFFFAARPEAANYTRIIRKDWVEKVGMKVEDLTSLEVYNEMLTKWKEAGLGKHGERLVANSFTYNYNFRDWPVNNEERILYSDLSVADFTTEATERYLRNLNYQYNNGLVDQEFYLRVNDNDIKAEFVAGRTGVFGLYLTANTDVISATLANDPEAEFAALDSKALTPADLEPQDREYWPFGLIMGVNYETSDEERIALWMYLEWLSQPENLFKMEFGVEGENYNLDEDGLAVPVAGFSGESKLSNNNNKDYWCLVTESAVYADPEITAKANILNWGPTGYEQLIIDQIKFYEDTEEYRTPDALFSVVLDSVNEYKADLNSLWQELYVKCAICPEDEFDATYEEAKEEYLSAGYQEILDEKQEAIDKSQYSY